MKEQDQHFGVFVEKNEPYEDGGHCWGDATERQLAWVELPSSGICHLAAAPGEPPHIQREPADCQEEIALCETVEIEGERCLVLVAQGNRKLRVNGSPLLRLEALHAGDELQLDAEYLLHVALRTCPYVGPPRPGDLGQTCLYCRTLIGPETTTVYSCVKCGRPFHCEGEEKSADQRLECARLMAECQQCAQPVITRESYSNVPQD
jgi:hypothetical protein